MEKRMTILATALGIVLAVSLSYNGYLYYAQTQKNSNHTFNFCWSPQEQNITSGNGMFWMNFTFKTVGENLSITVKINDDESMGEYPPADLLVMVFDKNRNGKIDYWDYGWSKDTVYAFGVNNYSYTWYILGPKGELVDASRPMYEPEPSPYHTCIWNHDGNLTFKINMALEEIGSTGIVHAVYYEGHAYDENHKPRFEPPESLIVYTSFSYLL